MATNANVHRITTPPEAEIVRHRVVDRPGRLFAAGTGARRIPRWWAQASHLTVVDKPEGRKGAGRRFIQRAPDGDELGSDGEYREIVPNERIVVTFRFEGMPPGHGAMQTALREERERKTAPRVALLCRTVADGDGRLKSGMVPDRRKL